VVAFTLSTFISLALCGAIVRYSKRRAPDAMLTWGEAMLGAFIVFFIFFWSYGVVPHQWLRWADNELGWRSDKIMFGWGNILKPKASGGSFPLTISYETIRDIIATMIYVVGLGINMAMWKIWQGRGKAPAAKAPVRSHFGRPLVKEGVEA